MTIEYINTGAIANDGTGDALREAFIKVNDNFEDLDLRVIEETVIQNVGVVGASVFSGKNDGVNEFKKIVDQSLLLLLSPLAFQLAIIILIF